VGEKEGWWGVIFVSPPNSKLKKENKPHREKIIGRDHGMKDATPERKTIKWYKRGGGGKKRGKST